MKSALTIAGFDPTGGAGLQADLKVFHHHSVHGLSVITAITAQNTVEVAEVTEVSSSVLKRQMSVLLMDIRPDAIKTGMLFSKDTVQSVKKTLLHHELSNLVIDPVTVSSSGRSLIEEGAMEMMKRELFPLARVITPNIYEATLFTGINILTKDDMKESARVLKDLGAEVVIITGGHLEDIALDLYYDGNDFREIESERFQGEFHGTGCVFSAAITANLALGHSVIESTGLAKSFISTAIKKAFHPGRGMGILHV